MTSKRIGQVIALFAVKIAIKIVTRH